MILELLARGAARPTDLDRDTFLAGREASRAAALEAAARLLDGDPSAAVAATGLPERALVNLVTHPPDVPLAGLAGALGLPEGLAASSGARAAPRWREWAWTNAAPTVADTPVARIAWGLDALGFLRTEIVRRQRAPWAAVRYAPTHADRAAAEAWAAWPRGPWAIRESWERAYLPWLLRAARAVLQARRVPVARRQVVADDLREAFFFLLLGGDERSAGWRELAARVVETAGDAGPVDAVARRLGPEDWARLGQGAVRRERWRRTLAVAFPEIGAPARGAAAARACVGDPGEAERLLDLHVALRAIDSWREAACTRPDRTWGLVTHNRGRARSRLRAVLSDRDDLPALLAALPALHSRTGYAVLRYGRDLTWSQVSRGFSFGAGTRLDPVCEERVADVGPALRAWVLLVVLKGRLGHLERWVATGATGDRDSTWGRLLARDLPPGLRQELRATLALALPAVLAGLRPTIVRLSEITEEPGEFSVDRVLDEVWHADVPRPRVRYAAYVAQARAFVGGRQ